MWFVLILSSVMGIIFAVLSCDHSQVYFLKIILKLTHIEYCAKGN